MTTRHHARYNRADMFVDAVLVVCLFAVAYLALNLIGSF